MDQPATLRKMPSLHDEDDRDLIAALSDSLAAPIPQPAPPIAATKSAMPAEPEADEAPMALDVPMAYCTVLAGVGRWPNLEAPEDFDGAVLSFLADTAPGMRPTGRLH